jgi:dihydroorotate dehydrogenase (NAD+) catalytic subunit
VHIPVFVKLSPNVTDITEVARAAESAGADAVTAINTVLATGMDVDSGIPILGGVLGGLSGPAIHPVALRAVYQISQAVRIPVIGVGGIEDWKGAVQMMIAGASAVQIGSAVTSKGLDVFREVNTGIGKFLERKGYSSIREIVSVASTSRVEG